MPVAVPYFTRVFAGSRWIFERSAWSTRDGSHVKNGHRWKVVWLLILNCHPLHIIYLVSTSLFVFFWCINRYRYIIYNIIYIYYIICIYIYHNIYIYILYHIYISIRKQSTFQRDTIFLPFTPSSVFHWAVFWLCRASGRGFKGWKSCNFKDR